MKQSKLGKADKKRKPRRTLEQKSAQQLVRAADEAFSKYVRIRDSQLKDGTYYGTCITCTRNGIVAWHDGTKLRYSPGWDAGHFVRRGEKVTRFEEENVNLQCSFRCNRLRSGEYEKYRLAVDLKYGEGTAEKLENLARTTTYYKFSKPELLQIIHDSKEACSFYETNLTDSTS